jgi:hypothetical protein
VLTFIGRLNPKPKHNTAELRFLNWVAYIRKYDPNVDEVQRRTCPLTECQEKTFSDEEAMLKHVRFCPGLSKGLYHCCECNTTEKISKVHKSGCKWRQPRKHGITGLLDQVRRGFSRSPSPDFPRLSGGPVKRQSLSQTWAEMPRVYSQNYTKPHELSSENAPCELSTTPNYFSMDFIQQNSPAELDVASDYIADDIFSREGELFGPGALYNLMSPSLGLESPPPYSSEAQWVEEKTSVCIPEQVQATQPIHTVACSRLPSGNTSFHYEHPTYKLAELADTSRPAELDVGSPFGFASNDYQAAGNAVATSSRPNNNFQCSSFEASCLQPTQFDTKTKYTIGQRRLVASYVDPPLSNPVASSSKRPLYADRAAPLASSPYESSCHSSSSAYPQQSLGFCLHDTADCDTPQRPSSPSDHRYHQAGFVSPVGSDTSSNPNITISPASSTSSSIDQLLLSESKNQAGTNQASLHYEHLLYARERRFPSVPGQTDHPLLIGQNIPTVPASSLPENAPSFRNFEDAIAGSPQKLLAHAIIDKEQ